MRDPSGCCFYTCQVKIPYAKVATSDSAVEATDVGVDDGTLDKMVSKAMKRKAEKLARKEKKNASKAMPSVAEDAANNDPIVASDSSQHSSTGSSGFQVTCKNVSISVVQFIAVCPGIA